MTENPVFQSRKLVSSIKNYTTRSNFSETEVSIREKRQESEVLWTDGQHSLLMNEIINRR